MLSKLRCVRPQLLVPSNGPALRNAYALGIHQAANPNAWNERSNARPSRAWVPTPMVTETIVSAKPQRLDVTLTT